MADMVVGVDVGTLSVRAGVFTLDGTCRGTATHPISIAHPKPHWAEQSGREIWEATLRVVQQAREAAGAKPDQVVGLGFDATCSLVLVDEAGAPLSVDPEGDPDRNVIVWMDHRATEEAEQLSTTGAEALRFVGGRLSPEMEVPKLAWLAKHLPRTFARIDKALDLADFLVWQASGDDPRSMCTTTCKWGYLAHESRFDEALYRAAGIERVLESGRAGVRIEPLGSRAGTVTAQAARALGVSERAAVAVGIIDAHAGGLGTLGKASPIERSLAVIAGTSACHMAVSKAPCFVPGVWGPYFGAMVPDLWLSEGGQSAAGALLDHIISSHARAGELGTNPFSALETLLVGMEASPGESPTHGLFVLPDFLGNRSPRADARARGSIVGLGLDASVEALARLYAATMEGIAYGTRHIVDTLNQHGHEIEAIRMCGGGVKNARWIQTQADVLGMDVGVVRAPDAMLLGSAILGAVAAGAHDGVLAAMAAMGANAEPIHPRAAQTDRHRRRYEVFLRMYEDQKAYRTMEQGPSA